MLGAMPRLNASAISCPAVQKARGGCARYAADGHMVEAEWADIRLVTNAAKHFVREYGRGDHLPAASPHDFRRGQYCRDTVARMARLAGAGVTVVEIEKADHRAVGERRKIGTRALAAEDDRCGLAARDRPGHFARDSRRLARKPAERAAHGIDDEPLRLMHDFARQVLIAQRGGVGTQLLDDRRH